MMTEKLREAAQRALETLEDVFGKNKIDVGAINMLRAALAESVIKDSLIVADELRRLQDELTTVRNEADAMEEFLGAAAQHEKEASAIINALTADIHITVPIRDYTEMSPKDCYELGMMDGVAALKSQINAAIDAAMKEVK